MASLVTDFEDVEKAYLRVSAELESFDASTFTYMNVDVESATAIVLGVADQVLAYRERIAKLPEFDMVHVDKLVDYAKAAWFLFVTNQLAVAGKEADALIKEAGELRAKLLVWAPPLVAGGFFEEAAVARIREGGGFKDLASDLVALVALYRSKWQSVGTIVGVTDEELVRAAQLGTAVFGIASRKENAAKPGAEGSLRLRKAWTRLELAYNECRRALDYLRPRDLPLDEIAPNLRRNLGPRGAKPAEASTGSTSSTITAGSSTTTAGVTGSASATTTPANSGGFGTGGSPFVKNG
jgi:hypothetical protein